MLLFTRAHLHKEAARLSGKSGRCACAQPSLYNTQVENPLLPGPRPERGAAPPPESS